MKSFRLTSAVLLTLMAALAAWIATVQPGAARGSGPSSEGARRPVAAAAPNICIAGQPNCGHPTPPPTPRPTPQPPLLEQMGEPFYLKKAVSLPYITIGPGQSQIVQVFCDVAPCQYQAL
jgi:hypothetical protein